MNITCKLPLNLKGGPTKKIAAAGTIECKYFYSIFCSSGYKSIWSNDWPPFKVLRDKYVKTIYEAYSTV